MREVFKYTCYNWAECFLINIQKRNMKNFRSTKNALQRKQKIESKVCYHSTLIFTAWNIHQALFSPLKTKPVNHNWKETPPSKPSPSTDWHRISFYESVFEGNSSLLFKAAEFPALHWLMSFRKKLPPGPPFSFWVSKSYQIFKECHTPSLLWFVSYLFVLPQRCCVNFWSVLHDSMFVWPLQNTTNYFI